LGLLLQQLVLHLSAGGPSPSTAAAPVEEKKVETKKEELKESDYDMGFSHF
jgi:ribosomal protein L12E/L44/L45/RPP1/RPP2